MSRTPAPVIVVGAGVAGLATALAAAPRPVLLLSATAHDSAGTASALAQGGIAAALAPTDSAQAHALDTHRAGAQHNAPALVRLLTREAAGAIAWLQTLGVAFDRDGEQLALAREGGHGVPRVVHAGGDATGARIMAALASAVRAAAHIQWRCGIEVDGLLRRGGRVAGVRARRRGDGQNDEELWLAGDVVLATGGIGGLFACTTNPCGAQGAGLALGLAVGAQMRDLEFVQFHPTALAVPARDEAVMSALPLITEALRGAGARLRDARGRALRIDHPMAELAPRDAVARSVWRSQRECGPVWLDARSVAGLARRFPTVHRLCMARGIDPQWQPIPVTPAAHFHMGGVATGRWGNTSVPGLYAVGEVACNGVHGANRLASNSLLEGVVFGRRLGRKLAQANEPRIEKGRWELAPIGAAAPAAVLARVRETMWRAAGPVRDARTLGEAIAELDAIAAWPARLGCALLKAALARPRSLGAHWRQDDAPAYVEMPFAHTRSQ